MSLQQSKTFFKKLKETCRKIDHDVNNMKKELYQYPKDQDKAAKKIREIQDNIENLRNDANILKSTLDPKLALTRRFITHFKELTSETEDLVLKQENYMKQYGYEPLEPVAALTSEPLKSSCSPEKIKSEEKENLTPTTPNLLDFGIISHEYSKATQIQDRKSSFEDLIPPPKLESKDSLKDAGESSKSTPTLEVTIPTDKDEETPPVPQDIVSSYVHDFPTWTAHHDFPSTPTLIL